MQFTIETKGNIIDLIRHCGYHLARGKGEELSFAKRLGSTQYPRFHLYIKQLDCEYLFNLHLDQKQPSYPGVHAHSGEYEGEILTQEAERIKEIINRVS